MTILNFMQKYALSVKPAFSAISAIFNSVEESGHVFNSVIVR